MAIDPFYFRGAGNGFPSCVPRVDVSDYDLIAPMTYNQAWRVYWLLAGATVRFYADGVETIETQPDYPEPDFRICRKREGWEEFDADPAEIRIYDLQVYAMYGGDPANDDNLLGYGLMETGPVDDTGNEENNSILLVEGGGSLFQLMSAIKNSDEAYGYIHPWDDFEYDIVSITDDNFPFVRLRSPYSDGFWWSRLEIDVTDLRFHE